MKISTPFLILIALMFSCKTIKKSSQKDLISWPSVICSVIYDHFPEFVSDPIDDCIKINPVVYQGGADAPRFLASMHYDLQFGRHAGISRIPSNELDCIPDVEVSYDPEYERIGCHGLITFGDPYFIDDSTVYISYSISIARGTSEGYAVVYKIRDYPMYDQVYKDQTYID